MEPLGALPALRLPWAHGVLCTPPGESLGAFWPLHDPPEVQEMARQAGAGL